MSEVIGQTNAKEFVTAIFAVVADDGLDWEGGVVANGGDLDEDRVFAGFFEVDFGGDGAAHAVVSAGADDVVVFASLVDAEGKIIHLSSVRL